MKYVAVAVLVAFGAWILAEPYRRRRQAEREGAHGLPFSRMLVRMVASGCVGMIALMVVLAPRLLENRGPLAELIYWCLALAFALVLGLAGFLEMQLVRRDYLKELRELYRSLAKPDPKRNGS